jgi:hypothetical protein
VRKISTPPHSTKPKERVVHLSIRPLVDAVYLALRKGLNYAVVPAVRSIENILTRVEKALKFLPAEMAEEVR